MGKDVPNYEDHQELEEDDESEEIQTGEEEEVMSEVHLGCPPRFSGIHLSRFTISIPTQDGRSEGCEDPSKAEANPPISLDRDGDLVLTRPKKTHWNLVSIKHRIKSSIPRVGLQVWKAAMVLADFVLHTCNTSSDFHDVTALELGSGTGLVGMVLARFARKVFLTDYDDEILDNCAENVRINPSFIIHEDSIHIRRLDWRKSWPPTAEAHDDDDGKAPLELRYSWTLPDIQEVERASVVLAADVIYSDELTDLLFGVLEQLMSRGTTKVLYLTLEKRYNFTMYDLDVVANGYWHFREYLKDPQDPVASGTSPPFFVGTKIDLDQIPQYLLQYDRGKDLEMWKITYSAPKNVDTTENMSLLRVSPTKRFVML